MKTTLFRFAALLALVIATTANAAFVSDRLGAIQPLTGMYFDRHQSGSGLFVDIGPNNSMFMIFATYDTSGNQANLLIQPNYVPSTEAVRASTGVIGTANDGQFYKVTGGQCPGCPFTPATITAQPIFPTFTWTRQGHVDMVFNGFTYHFDSANYEGKDDEEFLSGTFSVTYINDEKWSPGISATYSNTLPAALSIMRVVPAPFTTVALAPGSAADVTLPPAGAHLYIVQCAGSPDGADAAACNFTEKLFSEQDGFQAGVDQPLLWFDPATQSAGFELYHNAPDGAAIGPSNFHSPLDITPNTLQAHLQVQGTTGLVGRDDGNLAIALTFTRLPSVAVRDCFDYVATSCK